MSKIDGIFVVRGSTARGAVNRCKLKIQKKVGIKFRLVVYSIWVSSILH